jgi:circadian clock protein KaiB
MIGGSIFKFRLYVTGDTQNSAQALANLTAICREYLPNRHHVEVVNLLQEPQRALADGVLMTPTLVVLSPSPVRTIVGTLNQTDLVLRALRLETAAA